MALLIFAAREGQTRIQLLQLLIPNTGDAAGDAFETEVAHLVVDLAKKFTAAEMQKEVMEAEKQTLHITEMPLKMFIWTAFQVVYQFCLCT